MTIVHRAMSPINHGYPMTVEHLLFGVLPKVVNHNVVINIITCITDSSSMKNKG